MRLIAAALVLLLAIPLNANGLHSDTVPDTRRLGMAVDYFAGGKYHEALTLFIKLDKKYKLNPRLIAYIGICYYHEQDYPKACLYLDRAMPHIDVYAPAERNVYYNTAAESHFKIGEYDKAIPFYEKQILVCRKEEKADALYRLGFCHMFLEEWGKAAETFMSAAACYRAFPTSVSMGRLKQLDNMIKGCLQKAANQRAFHGFS